MSSPNSIKRRRLNNATATLSKPFVSPMRKNTETSGPGPREGKAEQKPTMSPGMKKTYLPSMLAHTTTLTPNPPGPNSTSTQTGTSNPLHPAPSKHRPLSKPRPNPQRPTPLNAQEQQTRRQITTLELRARTLNTDLETLRRAAALCAPTNNSSVDLAHLTGKWRTAAQQAAEELFGTAKERVCRMGGVGAWREAEKAKFERRSGGGGGWGQEGRGGGGGGADESDDADCEFDSQGEELEPAEAEYRKKEKRRVRREALEAADDGGMGGGEREGEEGGGGAKGIVWAEEGGGDDDEFTMDMMLRSLNIELALIGYDKHDQRWT